MTTLPAEILYLIFDRFSANDIHFSLRLVCKRLNTITNNYNRLRIKFTYRTSKFDIRRLCRIIQPENVISLNLQNSYFNSNTVKYFLSSIYLHQFSRLRSLILFDVEEYDFQTLISPLLMISILESVTLKMSEYKTWLNNSSDLLIHIIALPNISQLTLDISGEIINTISWPSTCNLQKLTLRYCSYYQLCTILDHSPNLRILTLKRTNMLMVHKTLHPTTFQSLTSLTLNNIYMPIDELEYLLSFQPNLVSLKFTTPTSYSLEFVQRLSQWENFIHQTIPLLKNFHFYIDMSFFELEDVESFLLPFCTTFWLQEKRWFITCLYTTGFGSTRICLYSSKNSTITFSNNLNYGLFSYAFSTASYGNQIDGSIMWSARFNVLWLTQVTGTSRVCMATVLKKGEWPFFE
ncbi:unnamed protein product [Rotaria sp. Silwood2]|nr:unnamed protein product [Rotaria sp. Silwood2]CAF4333138.1 unnamed protein product [Rotaria sp. Silwood2]